MCGSAGAERGCAVRALRRAAWRAANAASLATRAKEEGARRAAAHEEARRKLQTLEQVGPIRSATCPRVHRSEAPARAATAFL
jgi:hypothetical protein